MTCSREQQPRETKMAEFYRGLVVQIASKQDVQSGYQRLAGLAEAFLACTPCRWFSQGSRCSQDVLCLAPGLSDSCSPAFAHMVHSYVDPMHAKTTPLAATPFPSASLYSSVSTVFLDTTSAIVSSGGSLRGVAVSRASPDKSRKRQEAAGTIMPKNKGKGGKNRRRGKNENESEKRELVFKEDGQEYAQVIKMLGNGRLEAMCFDGVKRLCHIRGKLRKKVWINTSDIILVGLRDYQDNKADVILKYNADEARSLKAYGELPEHERDRDINVKEKTSNDFLTCLDRELHLQLMYVPRKGIKPTTFWYVG
ncbi:uncharacterized protein WM277_010804 [Molossus nigricans]